MSRIAPTEHPVHEIIRARWSPRAFADKAIPAEVLRSLFEAARWAPSSSNEQPWAFAVATRDEVEAHSRILSTLVEFNQVWAKHAPLLGIAVSALSFRNGNANRNAFYDTGAAMAYLTVEATTRGLFVHQMAGFDHRKASEVLSIPTGWEPIAAFVVGYPGDPQNLPETLREREMAERTRKPLKEFVMSGKWGEPARFLNQ